MATPQHALDITPELIAARMAIVANASTAPTLNGKPAYVGGYTKRFATVTERDSGLSAEWSWETVDHVMANRFGAFKA